MGADVGGDDPKKGTVYVNVIPMIDMLIILMVFLLSDFATSVFDDIKSLIAKMPVFDEGEPTDEVLPDPNKIQDLRVRMTKEEGFLVNIRMGEGMSQIPIPLKGDGSFDFAELSDKLLEVKKAYQDHEDALIEIDKGVKFQDIVDTMDAIREKVVAGSDQLMRTPIFSNISLTDTGTI